MVILSVMDCTSALKYLSKNEYTTLYIFQKRCPHQTKKVLFDDGNGNVILLHVMC